MYPCRPKAEAFSNAVDVVECLCDPTDPSTECTTPPRLAHVQLDDVPRALGLVEDEVEFCQLCQRNLETSVHLFWECPNSLLGNIVFQKKSYDHARSI